MSLLCSSHSSRGPFSLLKEGGVKLPQRRKWEGRSYDGRWQTVFSVGPVSSSHAGEGATNAMVPPAPTLMCCHSPVTLCTSRSHQVKPGHTRSNQVRWPTLGFNSFLCYKYLI